jgi:hypothetical protein
MREEVEAVATKRVLAWQLEEEMKRQHKTKHAMARDLKQAVHSSTAFSTPKTRQSPSKPIRALPESSENR